jgi:hypothetical protein
MDVYIDARRDFPTTNVPLECNDGTAYHQKTDIFKRIMWYSFDKHYAVNMVQIPIDRVKEIIRINKKGTKVDQLVNKKEEIAQKVLDYENVVGQDSLNRFDKEEAPKKPRPKRKFRRKPRKINKSND